MDDRHLTGPEEWLRIATLPTRAEREAATAIFNKRRGGYAYPEPELMGQAEDFGVWSPTQLGSLAAHLGERLPTDHRMVMLGVATGIPYTRLLALGAGTVVPDMDEYLAIGLALGVMDFDAPWLPPTQRRNHWRKPADPLWQGVSMWSEGQPPTQRVCPTEPKWMDECPELDIAMAVVLKAVEDLRCQDLVTREEARRLFLAAYDADPPEPHSLAWWCDAIGLDVWWVREMVRELVQTEPAVSPASPKRVDMTGQRFGQLLVMDVGPRQRAMTSSFWKCRCECGSTVVVLGKQLRDGTRTSCVPCAQAKRYGW